MLYSICFCFFDPSFLNISMEIKKIIIVISIILGCLGKCNTFFHMSQEFNLAIIDYYESEFGNKENKIETKVLIEFGSTLFSQFWQIGTFIIPMLISFFIDL